jgi:hypothetical protein
MNNTKKNNANSAIALLHERKAMLDDCLVKIQKAVSGAYECIGAELEDYEGFQVRLHDGANEIFNLIKQTIYQLRQYNKEKGNE